MLADVAHGIQTPLTVIKGELHFLKHEIPGSTRIETCERMVHEMSLLIYDLLHLARLNQADLGESMEDFDLSMLLHEVLDYFSVLAEQSAITIRQHITPGLVIRGLRERIEELIINLLSNSLKYMKEHGERTISVSLEETPQKAIVTISDSGIGISAEHLPHVFKRFYRVKNREGSSAPSKGSGLGLAIAKKIAEKHAADIGLTSSVGVGTTVTVRFPLKKSAFL